MIDFETAIGKVAYPGTAGGRGIRVRYDYEAMAAVDQFLGELSIRR